MSEPVISRRCAACGASYRSGAQFCHQCGNAVAPATATDGNDGSDANDGNNTGVANRSKKRRRRNREGRPDSTPTGQLGHTGDTRIMLADTIVEEMQPGTLEPQSEPVDRAPQPSPAGPIEAAAPTPVAPSPASPAVAATPPPMPVQTVAPPSPVIAAEQKGVSPTQKLRTVSTFVIEEATYDTGARFVLVAAALFLLFLVLLVMSHLVR
jgi:hypothetical protein